MLNSISLYDFHINILTMSIITTFTNNTIPWGTILIWQITLKVKNEWNRIILFCTFQKKYLCHSIIFLLHKILCFQLITAILNHIYYNNSKDQHTRYFYSRASKLLWMIDEYCYSSYTWEKCIIKKQQDKGNDSRR